MMMDFATGRLMSMLMGNAVCQRFLASQRGVAAVEFAMIMPVLLILFLSTFDVGNAILIYLKVRSATYELAAITNQYGIGSTAEISTSTMTAITGATSAVMAPFPASTAVVTISQISSRERQAGFKFVPLGRMSVKVLKTNVPKLPVGCALISAKRQRIAVSKNTPSMNP